MPDTWIMPKPGTKPRPEDTKQPRWWNVVLIDDDEHTYEYVIRMMQNLFAHPVEKAFQIAKCVDKDGRAICMTTHKELAELKRDQVLAFGRDPLMSNCKGSMTSIIEPAMGGGDDDNGGGDDKRGGAGGGGGGTGGSGKGGDDKSSKK